MTTIENICQLVCAEFGVTHGQLVGRNRCWDVALARQVAVSLASSEFGWKKAADYFKRKRVYVRYYAPEKVEETAEVYPAFSHKLEVLRKQVRGE